MGDRLGRKQLGRLTREATRLARKRNKTPEDRRRERELNADFERDMRARDKEPAPFVDTGR